MSLPSYIINFDELVDLVKDYLQNGINVDVGTLSLSTTEIEKTLNEIKEKMQGVDYNDLIEALNTLGVKIEELKNNTSNKEIQKIHGKMLEIPAIKGQYTIELNVSGKLTGVTYSQSAWRIEDSWDLVVGEKKLFDGIRTKEYGEYKHFNIFYPTNGTVKFIYNNTSGSSKVIWVDFAVIERVT